MHVKDWGQIIYMATYRYIFSQDIVTFLGFKLKKGKPIKLLLFGHRNMIRNTTQTAVINIFKIRILLNLTFRMFLRIHFQKYNRYGFWQAIYTTNKHTKR